MRGAPPGSPGLRAEPYSNEVGLRFDGITHHVIADAHVDFFNPIRSLTWAFLIKVDATEVTYVMSANWSTDSSIYYAFRVGAGTGNDYGQTFIRNTAFSLLHNVQTTQKVSDGLLHLWVIREDFVSGSNMRVYSSVDGSAYQDMGLYTRSQIGGTFNMLTIGAGRHTSGSGGHVGIHLRGDVFRVARFDNPLSTAGVAELWERAQQRRADLRGGIGNLKGSDLALDLWFGDGIDASDKLATRNKLIGHPTKGLVTPVNATDADFVLRAA